MPRRQCSRRSRPRASATLSLGRWAATIEDAAPERELAAGPRRSSPAVYGHKLGDPIDKDLAIFGAAARDPCVVAPGEAGPDDLGRSPLR